MKTSLKISVAALLVLAAKMTAAPPVAIYRTGANQMTGQQYATTQYTAPQNVTFADDPVSVHDGVGGTYTIVRDTGNWFWLNKFVPGSGWQGWVNTGGNGTGRAAMAVALDGTLYVIVRAGDSRYYLARRTTTGAIEGWYLLGVNQFSIDPSLAGPDQNGAYHVVGGDAGNLWRGFYYPQANFWSSTFQGWSAMGPPASAGSQDS